MVDPVGSGLVESLARPGGNVTGLSNFEYGHSPKWLDSLSDRSGSDAHRRFLRIPRRWGIGQFGGIQTAARALEVEVSPATCRAGEIERAVTTVARAPNGGLIVPASALANFHRDLIIALAAQHKLPAAYANRSYVTAGGLISYGVQRFDQYRRAGLSIASSRARSPPICRFCRRPSSSW